jgi:DNA-binding HxlR family transcriptional regulator
MIIKGSKVKISKILQFPSVKILMLIDEKEEVRHTDLTKIIASRGTLSANLKTLEKEKLVERRVETTKPIKTWYTLTPKGKEIALRLTEIEQISKK